MPDRIMRSITCPFDGTELAFVALPIETTEADWDNIRLSIRCSEHLVLEPELTTRLSEAELNQAPIATALRAELIDVVRRVEQPVGENPVVGGLES